MRTHHVYRVKRVNLKKKARNTSRPETTGKSPRELVGGGPITPTSILSAAGDLVDSVRYTASSRTRTGQKQDIFAIRVRMDEILCHQSLEKTLKLKRKKISRQNTRARPRTEQTHLQPSRASRSCPARGGRC